MIAKHKHGLFVLLVAPAIGVMAADAAAQCCGAPSYGVAYRAYSPVSYQTYSPVAYTTYRPYTGWYPGYWIDRARYAWWGGYTTSYAPTYSTYYRPAYYTSYASYAPVNSCSTCTTCYAPSYTACYDPCSGCSVGCVSGACCDGGGCAACGVVQTSADSYPSTTYQGESRPELAPGESPPAERTYRETEKPPSDNESFDLRPEAQGDSSDENASYLEAPRLFNPKDQTALRSGAAPVRTAVYRKPVAGQRPSVRNISVSRRQAMQDAEGWTSVPE